MQTRIAANAAASGLGRMIGERINEIDMQRTAGVTGSVGAATTTAGTETAETEQGT
jgi:hypothetical protein